MAIRLITGRLQQWSNACKKQFYEKRLHAVYKITKRCLPQHVAESTNRHITLHKRTGRMTNAETRHRRADSPSSPR